MNCETFERQLDDWLDGGLPESAAQWMTAHAANCAACAGLLACAHELARQAAALPQERRPAHDLWPGIAARLEQPRAQGPGLRAIAAGLALAVVFAGGMLTDRVLQESGEGAQTRMVESGNAERNALPGLREARRVLPASYVELIEGSGGDTDATEQALLRNLLLVNLAIKEVETAASEDPANASLRELLNSLYTQENRILGQAERLRTTRPAPTRTGI